MTVLNVADAVYLGTHKADKVYSGTNQVWPKPVAPLVPATPILDNFNRPDGALGANWIGSAFDWNNGPLVIAGNQLSQAIDYSSSAWHTKYDGDMEVYADVMAMMPSGYGNCLMLWVAIPQLAIDVPQTYPAPGYQLALGADGSFVITKLGNNLGNYYVPGDPWIAGDTYLLRVKAGVISGWRGREGVWVKQLEVTDTDYVGGYIGVEMWGSGAVKADNFGGGPI